jgi:hypothetical protein
VDIEATDLVGGWASEILHQFIGGKHLIIGFQPSKVQDFAGPSRVCGLFPEERVKTGTA